MVTLALLKFQTCLLAIQQNYLIRIGQRDKNNVVPLFSSLWIWTIACMARTGSVPPW